jgi:hypothetical protein
MPDWTHLMMTNPQQNHPSINPKWTHRMNLLSINPMKTHLMVKHLKTTTPVEGLANDEPSEDHTPVYK